MKNVINDIWHDLREKRLWPVALLLLIALVAVPVVLAKKSGGEGAAPTPVATPNPKASAKDDEELAKLATVELDESAPGEGSALDTFDPSNPFRPPQKVVDQEKQSDAGSTSAGPDDVSVQVDEGQTVTSGGGTGGSGGAGGGTTGGGTTGGGDQPQETVTTQYKYVIDVTFTANGRKRHVKGMDRLDMLPNEGNPLLLFLGAESDGDNAVFLVDSTLTAAGEGHCEPSAKECGFLHIGAGSEHEFTNEEGDSYTLRIDEIRKVKVDAKQSKASRKPRAGASVGATRRFVPLAISDLVSVSKTDADDSTTARDGR
jgi:hypothetical protein